MTKESGDKPQHKRSATSPFERFEELTRKLVAVPKHEIADPKRPPGRKPRTV